MTNITGKDATAEQTIELFGKNLKDLGLELEYTEELNPGTNLFSVVLQDKNNKSIRSNGKGMNLLAAKASAIGELAERFLNQAYFEDYYLGKDVSNTPIARYKNEKWFDYPAAVKIDGKVDPKKLMLLSKFYFSDDQRYNICYSHGEEFENEKDRKAWYLSEFCEYTGYSAKQASAYMEMPEDLFIPLGLLGNNLKQKLMLPTILPFTDRVTSNLERGICAVPLTNEHLKFNLEVCNNQSTAEDEDDSLYTFISDQENLLKSSLTTAELNEITELEKQNITYFPVRYLEGSYCSNGMCAGNSEYEAKVQGLSEICERFVRKFLYSKILPEEVPNLELKGRNGINSYRKLLCGTNRALPKIPDEFIENNFAKCAQAIKDIRNHGFDVVCYDASLGGIFPVTAVLLTKKNFEDSLYKLSIGAHPDMEISLERTLTEMFQGVVWNPLDLTVFDPEQAPREEDCKEHSNDEDYEELPNYSVLNFVGNFIDGSGSPFKSFFENASDLDFVNWSYAGHSNKEQYQFLLEQLAKFGKTVYCLDVSYKEIFAYRLIAPNFSEIYRCNFEEYNSEIMNMQEVQKLINCSGFNKQNFKSFVDDMDLALGNQSKDFHIRCGLMYSDNDPYSGWGTHEMELIAALGTKESKKEINFYLGEFFDEELFGESEPTTYFKCIAEILKYMNAHHIKDPENINLMTSSFNKEIIKKSKDFIKHGAPYSFLPFPGENLENLPTQYKLLEVYKNMIKLCTF